MHVINCIYRGTGGRTRTGTRFTASDFESDVSTNFTTPALKSRPVRAQKSRLSYAALCSCPAALAGLRHLHDARKNGRCGEPAERAAQYNSGKAPKKLGSGSQSRSTSVALWADGALKGLLRQLLTGPVFRYTPRRGRPRLAEYRTSMVREHWFARTGNGAV